MSNDRLEDRFIEMLNAGLEPMDDPEIRTAAQADAEFAKQLDALRHTMTRMDDVEWPALDADKNIDVIARAFEEGLQQGRTHALAKQSQRTFWMDGFLRFVPAGALVFIAIAAAGFLWQRGAQNPELILLRGEVQSLQQMVAVSLLEQNTAAQRLRGLQWSRLVDDPEEALLSAVSNTLRSDRNANVRLSAADALVQYADIPSVRRAVGEALLEEQDPIVQIQLIDFVLRTRGQQSQPVIRRLLEEPDLAEVVRNRANEALKEWDGR